MANTDYAYSAFTGIGGNEISIELLAEEFEASSIDNTFNHINNFPENSEISFVYAGTLDGAELTTLNNIVANHAGLPAGAILPSQYRQEVIAGDGTQDASICIERGGSTAACLMWNETDDRWEHGIEGSTTPIMRPTFAIWAEENSTVSVAANNYEFSFGNGATPTSMSDPTGVVMGVNATLIGISVSSRNTLATESTVSISVAKNGSVVATGGIASSTGVSTKCQNHTQITPDTVDFVPGDTVNFLTASVTGTHDDVVVTAWFERTS